mgnify:CR=1 FL=1
MEQKKGRVTIPTNLDVVKETLDIMNEWGAGAQTPSGTVTERITPRR